ncbi:hypothetical protein L2E82_10661 [Cichorium intybus]|uniref:Uncharacterized protein n=1 Tax=Cichorium intybus TaxID=13427 RepID=A0ACB9GB76_CICIN|nr:hypothetical protein L2E82_10661 [Cichorium intybus]
MERNNFEDFCVVTTSRSKDTSPFKDASEWLIFQRIIARDVRFPDYFCHDASDLIDKLLGHTGRGDDTPDSSWNPTHIGAGTGTENTSSRD